VDSFLIPIVAGISLYCGQMGTGWVSYYFIITAAISYYMMTWEEYITKKLPTNAGSLSGASETYHMLLLVCLLTGIFG